MSSPLVFLPENQTGARRLDDNDKNDDDGHDDDDMTQEVLYVQTDRPCRYNDFPITREVFKPPSPPLPDCKTQVYDEGYKGCRGGKKTKKLKKPATKIF